MSNTLDSYGEDDLKKDVLELMDKFPKTPGKISSEEIEKFYNSIEYIENSIESITESFIQYAYYQGYSWSKKSFKEIENKLTWTSNESYQYYRSPYFSILYDSNKGFRVNRTDASQEIRKEENDINQFVDENDYVYYAIKIFCPTDETFVKVEKTIQSTFNCRIKKLEIKEGFLAVIIPLSHLKLSSLLQGYAFEMQKINEKILSISNTMSNGFYLGGQKETTHIQISQNECDGIEFTQ